MSRGGADDNQLFIGRLPRGSRASELEDVFYKYGKMSRCDVKQGVKMAYGFIEYEDKRDAEDALRGEHGRDFNGARIVVEWARGPKDTPGPGGRGGHDRSRENHRENRHDNRYRDDDRDKYRERDTRREEHRRSRSRSPRHSRRRSHSPDHEYGRRRSYSRSRSRSPDRGHRSRS